MGRLRVVAATLKTTTEWCWKLNLGDYHGCGHPKLLERASMELRCWIGLGDKTEMIAADERRPSSGP